MKQGAGEGCRLFELSSQRDLDPQENSGAAVKGDSGLLTGRPRHRDRGAEAGGWPPSRRLEYVGSGTSRGGQSAAKCNLRIEKGGRRPKIFPSTNQSGGVLALPASKGIRAGNDRVFLSGISR